MRVLRVLGFYLVAIAVLGSLGFIGWLWSDRLLFRAPFWPTDAIATWAIALAVTGVFLALVCLPLLLLTARFRTHLAAFVGLLSGPVFVWLLLALRNEPLSLRNYLTAPGVVPLHLIFAAIGLLFALGLRVYGPNNSFKPNSLRGSA